LFNQLVGGSSKGGSLFYKTFQQILAMSSHNALKLCAFPAICRPVGYRS
jgi:hypothetical protein